MARKKKPGPLRPERVSPELAGAALDAMAQAVRLGHMNLGRGKLGLTALGEKMSGHLRERAEAAYAKHPDGVMPADTMRDRVANWMHCLACLVADDVIDQYDAVDMLDRVQAWDETAGQE